MASIIFQQVQKSRDQLHEMLKVWKSLAPSLPASIPFNATTLSPKDIETALEDCLNQLTSVSEQNNPNELMLAIHGQNIINMVTQLTAFISSGNPAALAQNFQNIVNHVWTLQSSLVWVAPFDINNSSFVTYKTKDLESKAKTIRAAVVELKQISNAKEQIELLQAEIASTNATVQASAAKIAEERKTIEIYSENLKPLIKTQKDEINKLQDAHHQIEKTLEGASQLGLARSFVVQHKRLQKQVIKWEKIVAVSFGALFTVAIVELFLVAQYAIEKRPLIDLLPYLPPLVPIISAAIFVVWYAIKQRGTYRNLSEDYAFKQATAMAFYGYRKEMGEDAEMIKQLREVSIENFGANPTRMLLKNEPATPIHDALDGKQLEGITKLLKDLKELFTRG